MNKWRWGQPAFEEGIIRDVQAGKADLGWAATRAWDSVGVSDFDALHAPLLIDSYALEGRVIDSRATRAMLAGLPPLGLQGVAVLPGRLRRLASAGRPWSPGRPARTTRRDPGIPGRTCDIPRARSQPDGHALEGLSGSSGRHRAAARQPRDRVHPCAPATRGHRQRDPLAAAARGLRGQARSGAALDRAAGAAPRRRGGFGPFDDHTAAAAGQRGSAVVVPRCGPLRRGGARGSGGATRSREAGLFRARARDPAGRDPSTRSGA